MSILSGYGKYKRYILTSEGYKLCSQWTSSNTVEMGDGNTAETNLGSIKGITDSLTATSSNIALSASAGNNLQTQVDTLNSNLIVPDYKSAVTIQNNYICASNGYVIGTIQGEASGWASIRSSNQMSYFLALCTSSDNPIAVCIPFAAGDTVIFGEKGIYNLAFVPTK